jgi:hypothetical protein
MTIRRLKIIASNSKSIRMYEVSSTFEISSQNSFSWTKNALDHVTNWSSDKQLVLRCGSLLYHLICVSVIEPSWFYVFYDSQLLPCLIYFIDSCFMNMMTLCIKLLSCSGMSKILTLGMLMSQICNTFIL